MMPNEARWIRAQIETLGPDVLFPMCNVGGSLEALLRARPWVGDLVLEPVRQAGRVLVSVDRRPGPGVDVVADPEDPAALERLGDRGFRAVLCAGLLTHVPDPAAVAARLVRLIPRLGYLIVTTPFVYPHDPDPIDTMFRPGVLELARLFPGTRLCGGSIVDAGMKGLPFRQRLNPLQRLRHTPWLFRRCRATCVLLERIA